MKNKNQPWWTNHAFRKTNQRAEVIGQPLHGAPVAIVGGGPGMDPKVGQRLCTGRCVAVNNSYMLTKMPTVVVALDRRWWEWHGAQIKAGGHIAVTSLRERQTPHTNFDGFAFNKIHDQPYTDQTHTLAGMNSGHAAISLAMHLGATEIYLAGFDMGFDTDKTHWHTPHNVPANPKNYEVRFRPLLEALIPIAADKGVSISAITPTFANIPTTPLDEALERLNV